MSHDLANEDRDADDDENIMTLRMRRIKMIMWMMMKLPRQPSAWQLPPYIPPCLPASALVCMHFRRN
jgi:hypothetical protein